MKMNCRLSVPSAAIRSRIQLSPSASTTFVKGKHTGEGQAARRQVAPDWHQFPQHLLLLQNIDYLLLKSVLLSSALYFVKIEIKYSIFHAKSRRHNPSGHKKITLGGS